LIDEINNIKLYYDSDSNSENNLIEIKEINLVDPENNIKETNWCEINTTSDDNHNN